MHSMGGLNSGGYRWGKRRTTVEACFRIDAKMLRAFVDVPEGQTHSLTVGWSGAYGAAQAQAAYRGGDTFFTLAFRRLGAGETTQPIALSFSPCGFGGRRVWMHCGLCKRRVFRLYLPLRWLVAAIPQQRFFCRTCLGLSYEQRRTQSTESLAQLRARRIRQKLGAPPERWDCLPFKPRGMQWSTYANLAAAHRALCEMAYAAASAHIARLFPPARPIQPRRQIVT